MNIFGEFNFINMEGIKEITPGILRTWLETGKPVSILNIRPNQERAEWFIPGSIYFSAYEQLKANSPEALKGLYLDKTIPVVCICGGGITSWVASGILQNKGFESYSLGGGINAWRLLPDTTTT